MSLRRSACRRASPGSSTVDDLELQQSGTATRAVRLIHHKGRFWARLTMLAGELFARRTTPTEPSPSTAEGEGAAAVSSSGAAATTVLGPTWKAPRSPEVDRTDSNRARLESRRPTAFFAQQAGRGSAESDDGPTWWRPRGGLGPDPRLSITLTRTMSGRT